MPLSTQSRLLRYYALGARGSVAISTDENRVEIYDGQDGFLPDDVSYVTEISRENIEILDLARRVNRECHSLVFGADIRNRDGQAMVVAALFLRALQHFQAAILLLSRGMIASGKVAIRAELEAVFATRAIAADEMNFRAFVNDDLRQRLYLIKASRKYEYPIMQRLRQEITEEEFSRLEEEVKMAGALSKVTISDLSRQAQLHDLYVSIYPVLSTAAHSGIKELDTYFVLGSDGAVEEIEYAPEREGAGDYLTTACDFILLGTDAICHQFEIANFNDVRRELSAVVASTARSRRGSDRPAQ